MFQDIWSLFLIDSIYFVIERQHQYMQAVATILVIITPVLCSFFAVYGTQKKLSSWLLIYHYHDKEPRSGGYKWLVGTANSVFINVAFLCSVISNTSVQCSGSKI